MWCKFPIYPPMSQSKQYWDQCMPTSFSILLAKWLLIFQVGRERIRQSFPYTGPPATLFIALHVYILAPHSFNKISGLLLQSQPEESTHLETGQVLKRYRARKGLKWGLVYFWATPKMLTVLELIWVPWILSTRSFFTCVLSFGGDCIYCQTLSTIDADKDIKTWFSVTLIILFPEGTMPGGRTTELSPNQKWIDTQCASCVNIYMKRTHHMCIQTLARRSRSLNSVGGNWN